MDIWRVSLFWTAMSSEIPKVRWEVYFDNWLTHKILWYSMSLRVRGYMCVHACVCIALSQVHVFVLLYDMFTYNIPLKTDT